MLYHSVEFGTLHLAIFLRRYLIWVCSGIHQPQGFFEILNYSLQASLVVLSNSLSIYFYGSITLSLLLDPSHRLFFFSFHTQSDSSYIRSKLLKEISGKSADRFVLLTSLLVPESDSLSTRAASAFRTKGGIAIGFSIFGTSLLFLNCHLTALAEKVKVREKDLKKIFHSLDLQKELPVRKKHRGYHLTAILINATHFRSFKILSFSRFGIRSS